MPEREHVTIIGGSGDLGQALAGRLAQAGIGVTIGSRKLLVAAAAVARVIALLPGAAVDGLENPAAVASAEVVFLCVPFATQAQTLRGLREYFREGQILVDASVPLAVAVGGKPTRMLGVWEGSAAQQAQELVPDGVTVVSALHTVSAAMLGKPDQPLDEDILLCGNDKAAKQRVAALLERIPGLRSVDCGRLEQARTIEALTAMLIGINIRHKTHAGIRITGLRTAPEPTEAVSPSLASGA
jgi:8-hydroxy-5-deazaflavin:NADPH oxidoreductase